MIYREDKVTREAWEINDSLVLTVTGIMQQTEYKVEYEVDSDGVVTMTCKPTKKD